MEFKVGPDIIKSYKRLSYSPWHAIAELVDNSTQSYFNYQHELRQKYNRTGEKLEITIAYDRESDLLRISDNSIGMSKLELEDALHIGKVTDRTSGRSKYGMGLKTAACWLGNMWTVRTKKLGDSIEHYITIDVEEIAKGNKDLHYRAAPDRDPMKSYTIIEVTSLNRQFHGRTLGKIGDYLSSMYRVDLRKGDLKLVWRDQVLQWKDFEFLKDRDGQAYKRKFRFEVDGKTVKGWVGILEDGSRAYAGFSIIQNGRVIRGWPDSWRPFKLFGLQEQGSNNLVNQRLVGEIELDGFEVSHTKDDIQWFGSQEEEVEEKLYQECIDYKRIASIPKKRRDDERGPSELETSLAVDELRRELFSPEMMDSISLTVIPENEVVDANVKQLTQNAKSTRNARLEGEIGGIFIKLYVNNDSSPSEPYVTVEATEPDEVIVVVNSAHPHWAQIKGDHGALNYLRHCVYDGVSEHMARHKKSTINPNTIKLLKDSLLRVTLNIEQSEP